MCHQSSSKLPSKPPPSTSKKPKRLFTPEDEIHLLKSLMNSTRSSLLDGRFSEAQITHKIKRLKQKYNKQAKSKSSIKTYQDLKTYEISREIWGPKTTEISPPKPSKNEKKKDSKGKNENTIKWSDFPFLMRQVPANNEVYKQGLMGLGEDVLKGLDKKWMELEMEEAAIQARRAELVYTQLKSSVMAESRN